MAVLSAAWNLGTVNPNTVARRHLTLAYDQVVSMRYFGTDMMPLWRMRWLHPFAMLEDVESSRINDLAACAAFDADLISRLTARGGDEYATLGSLVYRQVTGGTQAVWNPVLKEPWVFMKEISSDGDVSTVDVIYPAFPMFQYLYPEYFRKILMPLLVYGNNETAQYGMSMPYDLAWAPHHLGTWPICDLAPNQQEQMPMEESGNMLIMMAALLKNSADASYLKDYWKMLDSWADYTLAALPDPDKQLCTDDFEGPSPHNTNLAAKGMVALDAWADVVLARGDEGQAAVYRTFARTFAKNWTEMAADGSDHFRIQFNLPSTWSLKYNLFFQKVLGLETFPQSVFDKENAYYQTKLEKCGVPLDNRHPYTKSDWTLWSGAVADNEQFSNLVGRLYHFAHVTESRWPLTDWYDVETCRAVGFRARPVQGGFFARMLINAEDATSSNLSMAYV